MPPGKLGEANAPQTSLWLLEVAPRASSLSPCGACVCRQVCASVCCGTVSGGFEGLGTPKAQGVRLPWTYGTHQGRTWQHCVLLSFLTRGRSALHINVPFLNNWYHLLCTNPWGKPVRKRETLAFLLDELMLSAAMASEVPSCPSLPSFPATVVPFETARNSPPLYSRPRTETLCFPLGL